MGRLRAIRSYYSSREGGLVTLEDDVLSIVSQVREEYGEKVTIELDPSTGWFHFVGHENDADYLIFSAEKLDPRTMERLRQSDSRWIGFQDPYDAAEREQDRLQEEMQAELRDQVLAHGERLAHALKADGVMPRLPLSVAISRSFNADR